MRKCVLFMMLVLSAMPVLAGGDRPNIIFILADDLGIGDVKCYGGDRSRIETPHIDAVAAAGMRFTDAHPAASVCVPSRIAIMTGRYAWRFGKGQEGGKWGFLGPRFDTNTFTLGRMFKGAGYRTGYVGKWHLGTVMTTKDGKVQNETNVDYTKPLKIGPPQYGFDNSFILPASLDMYPYVYVRNNRFVGEVTAQKGWSAFNRVGPAEKDFEDFEVLDTLSGQAERFIAESAAGARDGSKPFFLYFALTSPHTPLSPRPEFQGKSVMGLYGDFVMETDDCVGRVNAALDRHGLSENTLLIVTSDHGPASYAGDNREATEGQIKALEARGHWPAGIYRGYKFSVYEGGLRVPFIVRWPGVVRAGSQCDGLVGLNDLMRTCAEIVGADLKENQAPDSISMLGLLRDCNAVSARSSMVLRSSRNFVIRKGDWKLALCPGSGSKGLWGNEPSQEEAWRGALAAFGARPSAGDLKKSPFVQLFDLRQDPSERRDLAARYPERIQSLMTLLERQIEQGRSTPGLRLQNDTEVNCFAGSQGLINSLSREQ